MLQKKDKERLAKVLNIYRSFHIRFPDVRFPQTLIVQETGENKGTISAFLSGKRPMTDSFYNSFMEKFGTDEKSDYANDISGLIANNKLLAEAFLKLGAAQEKEAEARAIQAKANKLLADNLNELVKHIKGLMRP